MYVAVIRFPDSQEDLDYKSSPSLSCQQIYHIRGASRQGRVNFGNLLRVENILLSSKLHFWKKYFQKYAPLHPNCTGEWFQNGLFGFLWQSPLSSWQMAKSLKVCRVALREDVLLNEIVGMDPVLNSFNFSPQTPTSTVLSLNFLTSKTL